MRREPLDIAGVIGGGGTEDGHVRPCRHASVEVGEDIAFRDAEFGCGTGHRCGVRIVDPCDLGIRVVVHHAQQIAHVHVVKADADDTEPGHENLRQLRSVMRT